MCENYPKSLQRITYTSPYNNQSPKLKTYNLLTLNFQKVDHTEIGNPYGMWWTRRGEQADKAGRAGTRVGMGGGQAPGRGSQTGTKRTVVARRVLSP